MLCFPGKMAVFPLIKNSAILMEMHDLHTMLGKDFNMFCMLKFNNVYRRKEKSSRHNRLYVGCLNTEHLHYSLAQHLQYIIMLSHKIILHG